MRPIYILILFALIVASCKKEVNQSSGAFSFERVKQELKDSMQSDDYAKLDFSKVLFNHVDSVGLYFLRVPFQGISIAENFVLIKLNRNGNIKEGKIIQLNGGVVDDGEGPVKKGEWEGSVSISSLNRNTVLNSAIHKGYIEAFHPQENTRETLMEANVLPEVVVVAYVNRADPMSTWLWLNSFFYINNYDVTAGSGGGGGGSTGNYYGSFGGYGGSGGGYNGGGALGSGVRDDQTIELEPEYIYSIPEVDLTRLFKCFDYVPSAGATYSVKLCVDIPSNGNPMASTGGYSSTGVGHSYLVVTMTNGTITVNQSFGFYPKSMPSFLHPFSATPSTIKDNGAQEINASIQMSLTETQFKMLKQNAIASSKKQYQLGDYNCTNYALDIFNSTRSSPLVIQPYKVVLPGNTNPWAPAEPITVTIEKSPQMLFAKLQEMKNKNSAESAKIVIDQSHNSHSPVSKGECD